MTTYTVTPPRKSVTPPRPIAGLSRAQARRLLIADGASAQQVDRLLNVLTPGEASRLPAGYGTAVIKAEAAEGAPARGGAARLALLELQPLALALSPERA